MDGPQGDGGNNGRGRTGSSGPGGSDTMGSYFNGGIVSLRRR